MKKSIYISIVLVLLVILFICLGVQMYESQKKSFSAEKWNTNIWEREKMIDDLTQEYDLTSMNSDEVLKLLGTNGLVEDSFLIYYVGKSYAGPVLFSISFDESGNVSSYGIIVD